MTDFLFEIGLEEIPARMIASAQAELERRTYAMLERERLLGPEAQSRSFSTPRRLAVLVSDVLEQQPDLSEEMVGPAVKIAYKDGVATPAALAFARKAGVEVDALRTVTTPKGEYLAATSLKPGKDARAVIEAELPRELAAIYWAKNMYWRPGKPERFVRPVRWLLALLGDEGVPLSFAGFVAVDMTIGHRVLCLEEMVTMGCADQYEQVLERCFVMADVEKRRQFIRKALDRVCRTVGGMRWREDHALVDKMTHITEWPSVIMGRFDEEFLALPEEVLVTVMRDHQNYFAVEDKSGRLAPYFLAVLNTVADEAGEAVIRHGNERVLRARFNDARFFWEFDQRTPLVERVKLLEHVTFQKDLGSYRAKSERVRALTAKLAEMVSARGFAVDRRWLDDAALLAKTDLTAELVKEFTELQGEIGGLYARAQGLGAGVADAIYDQYRPESMDSAIARTAEGQLLAIADKADTIAGMFGLGLEPTGSKDPFALRRAANGVVKTLAESEVPLLLSEVASSEKMMAFFGERLEFYLREARGQAYDVVKAVLAAGGDDVRDALARAEAVSAVRGTEEFLSISAAFKRMSNILAQAVEKNSEIVRSEPVFHTQYEAEFWEAVRSTGEEFKADCDGRKYDQALAKLARLRDPIDKYFEETMVMAEDLGVRANRLGMLRYLVTTFTRIADFSEIVVAG